jgi:hypothetical protein
MTSGLAIGSSFPNAATLPPLVLLAVSEAEAGGDRNGDADLLDLVMHRYDTTTGGVVNLGFAALGPVVVSDRHFAFVVSEAGQFGSDFNGDGDTLDGVWFVYDPARPLSGTNPLNTGVAAPTPGLAAAGTTGGFVLLESEGSANADRNGDGDTADIVPRAFDGVSFAVSSLLLPAKAPGTPLVASSGRVLYTASETAQGAFLNGDGDPLDVVLFAVDFTVGLPTRVAVGAGFPRAVAGHPYALAGGAAVYMIDEAGENAIDLNNDGDAIDAVLAVFRFGGGGEILPSNPLIASLAVAGAPAVGIGAGAARAIVAVSEAGQKRDINNDFDQTDFILAWIDTTAPGTIHLHVGLALAAKAPAISGIRGLVTVSEAATGFGGTDLNGDGDRSDGVVFVLDTSAPPGSTINLALAIAGHSLQGVDALLGVDEASQGNADMNGNGTRSDILAFYADLADAAPAPRGLGIVMASQNFFRLASDEVRIAAVIPEGQSANYFDLNKDGDALDAGLELIAVDPTFSPPPVLSPTPFFAGIADGGGAPPLRTGDGTFVFPTSEAMANTDLNADADLTDTVLCVTRIQ